MSQATNKPSSNHDVIIVGGGITGATTALALAQLGLSIGLIEAIAPKLEVSPSFDQRAVALSAASVKIFQSLNLWPALSEIACPIKFITVSDQGNCGFTRLNANDYQLDALGQVIPLEQTGPVLWKAIHNISNIQVYTPATVTEVISNNKDCQVSILKDDNQVINIKAKLLLAADGSYSKIAQHLGITINRKSYAQEAIIANVETEIPHQNKAFERFTPSGPLALLPLKNIVSNQSNLKEHRLSLVWCHSPLYSKQVMAFSDEEFSQALQNEFGYRLGKITLVGKRFCYPLSLHKTDKGFCGRVLLLGNAAHTLHPIAGQGFNLGLRDIAALVEKIEDALIHQKDIGDAQLLAEFCSERDKDWQQTITATDVLVHFFSNNILPLAFVRNKLMTVTNQIPFLKGLLAKNAMGFVGRASRLARGFKLEQDK